MIASFVGRLGRSTATATSASSRVVRSRHLHVAEVSSGVRWPDNPKMLKYSTADLRSFSSEFEKYAEGGEMNVESFERLVIEKTAHFGFQSVQLLDHTVSTLSWWQTFDEDENNYVDFSEFVTRYPSMVRILLRRSVRHSGAQAFFDAFAVDGKFTHESILAAIARYGLDPYPEADVDKLMKQIAPHREYADHEDIEFWANSEDYSSVSCCRGSSVFHKDFYDSSFASPSVETSTNACVHVP
jgi:hypothetical protein